MADWRERALVGLAMGVLVLDVSTAQSLPADSAENAAAPRSRAGIVTQTPQGAVALADVEAAVRDDAGRAWRLDDTNSLQVITEEVTWADGSLGCPRPGMAYTQALVPGWRLIVRKGGREAVYHASLRGQWLLCQVGRGQTPLPSDAKR